MGAAGYPINSQPISEFHVAQGLTDKNKLTVK